MQSKWIWWGKGFAKGTCQRNLEIFVCRHSDLRHSLHWVWESDRQRLEFKFISTLWDEALGCKRLWPHSFYQTRRQQGWASGTTAPSPARGFDLISTSRGCPAASNPYCACPLGDAQSLLFFVLFHLKHSSPLLSPSCTICIFKQFCFADLADHWVTLWNNQRHSDRKGCQ